MTRTERFGAWLTEVCLIVLVLIVLFTFRTSQSINTKPPVPKAPCEMSYWIDISPQHHKNPRPPNVGYPPPYPIYISDSSFLPATTNDLVFFEDERCASELKVLGNDEQGIWIAVPCLSDTGDTRIYAAKK